MASEGASEVNVGGRLLPQYEETLMGVPVILLNSAVELVHDGVKTVTVPEPEALEAAVAFARVMMKEKLNGEEIKFVRRAISAKAVDLAEYLDVRPETLSRWENNKEIISRNAEMLLRFRVVARLKDKAPGVPAKASDLVDLRISPFRDAGFCLRFERLLALRDGKPLHVWCLRDVEDTQAVELKRA